MFLVKEKKHLQSWSTQELTVFYLCFKTLTIQTAWCVAVGEPQQGRLTLTFPRLAVFKGYFTC